MKTKLIITENQLKTLKKILLESNDDTYFETLSGVLEFVRNKAEEMGLEVDDETIFQQFGTGGVPYGTTKKAFIPLLKNGEPILGKSGKPLNRGFNVVVYRMDSGRYELTLYKSW